MYRITGMNGKYYALRISSIEDDADNIEIFVKEGDGVIIVDALSDISNFGIDRKNIEIIEPD